MLTAYRFALDPTPRQARYLGGHCAAARKAFTTGGVRCEERHAVLPRIGAVKLHEYPAKLLAALGDGARIMSATIRFERGRRHMSFTVEQDVPEPPVKAGPVVGVDLGIKHLAVLSTGEKIENPRHLSASLRKLGRLSRAVSRRQDRTGEPGGGRRTDG